MKSVILMWGVLLAIGSVFAAENPKTVLEKYETRVVKVAAAANAEESSLVFLEAEGRVLRLDATQISIFEQLKAAAQSGDVVKVKVRDMGTVDFVSSVDTKPMSARLLERMGQSSETSISSFDDLLPQLYEPTDVGSLERANSIFYSLDRSMKKRSQCYQRAHLWAYSMWRGQSIKSQKVFMFYTQRYIRNYKFKWWFHVSPFVVANKVEYVVDRTFTGEALTMKEWTDVFMENHASCPSIEKYSDYENHQQSQDCYLFKVPMYYYQPVNLEALEAGEIVDGFRSWEIDHAKRADK